MEGLKGMQLVMISSDTSNANNVFIISGAAAQGKLIYLLLLLFRVVLGSQQNQGEGTEISQYLQLPQCIAPPIFSILSPSGIFSTRDDPTWTYHPSKSIVCIELHSVNLDTYIMTHRYH